jgi:hypothetical protein
MTRCDVGIAPIQTNNFHIDGTTTIPTLASSIRNQGLLLLGTLGIE